MICTRCGNSAVVKRADGYYCGKCALTRDWREIIDIIQDARVETPVAGGGAPAADEVYEADPFVRSA